MITEKDLGLGVASSEDVVDSEVVLGSEETLKGLLIPTPVPEVITLSDIFKDAINNVSVRERAQLLKIPTLADVLPKLDGVVLGEQMLVREAVKVALDNGFTSIDLDNPDPAFKELLSIIRAFYVNEEDIKHVLKQIEIAIKRTGQREDSDGIKYGLATGIAAAVLSYLFLDQPNPIINFFEVYGLGMIGGIGGGYLGGRRSKRTQRLELDEKGGEFVYKLAAFANQCLKQLTTITEDDESRKKEILLEAVRIIVKKLNGELATIGIMELDSRALQLE